MHPDTFTQAQHAAELVGLAVYARAVLARAVDHDPNVVAVRIDAATAAGEPGVIGEFINAEGQALGGFQL